MLEIRNINKQYQTGEFVQDALDDVSLSFRENEFVAVLGPSGSGKTTLLNIVGGLDQYDSGDIIIEGKSTKEYKDRDWDSYRNHSIGFVFQSYNLIPHQSVLANVELAMTIAGLSTRERRSKARKALDEVGLLEHQNKKPNQLSGGQMQRVAIARALVNDPQILLADEPTGALDSETSVQILNLLSEVAEDRLVIMVTHDEDLAKNYATRIIRLRDGQVIDDEDHYEVKADEGSKTSKPPRVSMSFLTSLLLSFNNLWTKKGRTLLISLASSIGIIGIALILALSNGVNNYILDLQADTLTSYPIEISAETMDLTALVEGATIPGQNVGNDSDNDPERDDSLVYANYWDIETDETFLNSVRSNNLSLFKEYLDDTNSEIHQYIGENGIVYTYDVNFDVFVRDSNDDLVNTDSEASEGPTSSFGPPNQADFLGGSTSGAENFSELMEGTSDDVVSQVITDSYDLVYGSWPSAGDEVVLILNSDGTLTTNNLYQLGYITADEYDELTDLLANNEELPEMTWTFEELASQIFYLLPASDRYIENEDGTFTYLEESALDFENYLADGIELKISGIIKPIEDATNASITTPVAYTSALTDYLITHVNEGDVVLAQAEDPEINVLTGLPFAAADDAEKVEVATQYVSELGVSEKASLYMMIMSNAQAEEETEETTQETESTTEETTQETETTTEGTSEEIPSGELPDGELPDGGMPDGGMPDGGMPDGGMPMQPGAMDESALAGLMDQWLEETPDEDVLISLYDSFVEGESYEENMAAFGQVSYDSPATISIYTDSFEGKDGLSLSIENYNNSVDEVNQITYVDLVELLTSTMTQIITVITYVLIAFVAISLVVSAIMIGIITYISVLERTKEIGILRALGASKKNISQLFNAETFIIGLISGLLGIGIAQLLTIPMNSLIQILLGTSTVSAALPGTSAVFLVILSVIITVLGGLIPANKAAKQDPVIALRAE